MRRISKGMSMLKLDTKVTVGYISGLDLKPTFSNAEYKIWESNHGYILLNKIGEYFIMTKVEYNIFISQYDHNNILPMG